MLLDDHRVDVDAGQSNGTAAAATTTTGTALLGEAPPGPHLVNVRLDELLDLDRVDLARSAVANLRERTGIVDLDLGNSS